MTSGLLTCLRGAGQRLRPALSRDAKAAQRRGGLRRAFRRLAPAFRIPARLPAGVRYYLPSTIAPNSKGQAVLSELTAAGVPSDAIWTYLEDRELPWLRFLRRLPQIAAFFIGLYRRRTRFDSIDQEILLGRELYCTLMRRNPEVVAVIISDVSPELHMLWSASVREGNPVLWWQDDYHHAGPLPYPVQMAAVLNQNGLRAVAARSPAAQVLARPSTPVLPLRSIPDSPRLGVATNASFEADADQIAKIGAIREALGARNVALRLHPNSRIGPSDIREAWLEIAPRAEPLADFARRIDLAIVGNSAVQLRLLGEGVPVLHVRGLDAHDYDLYGYVRRGFSFGDEAVDKTLMPALNRHYSDTALRRKLSDFLHLDDAVHLPGLAALCQSSMGPTLL